MTIASSNRLSDRKIRANFTRDLKAAIETGQGPFTEQGYSFEVFKALWDLAESWPGINNDLIRKARMALERQLLGAVTASQPPVGPEISWPNYLA